MLVRFFPLLALSTLVLFLTGCTRARVINVEAPRPATAERTSAVETDPAQAALSVVLHTGASALPDGVEALRFSVNELWLHPSGGSWRRWPVSPGRIEVVDGRKMSRTLLSTRVPPAAYDSIAVTVNQVWVQYSTNTGGPLVLQHGPTRLPVSFVSAADTPATLHLQFEPGASIWQNRQGTWFFLPLFIPSLDGTSPP